jgi:putative methylase
MQHLKKSELINVIQSLKKFDKPKIKYEQYITDAISTADLMYHIAYEQQDFEGNILVDLGCGTGNLTIAAVLLGCENVISIDIDQDALDILEENAMNLQISDKIQPIKANICQEDIKKYIQERIDILNQKGKITNSEGLKIVVLSNPPFGVHNRGVDVKFLEKALSFANIIYSIHLSNDKSYEFLQKKISLLKGRITHRSKLTLTLKNTYKFHSKAQKKVETDVYRIVSHKKILKN